MICCMVILAGTKHSNIELQVVVNGPKCGLLLETVGDERSLEEVG